MLDKKDAIDFETDPFKKELMLRIKKDPSQVKELMTAILTGLDSYKQSMDDDRDSRAWNALHIATGFMINSKEFKNCGESGILYLIDCLYYLHPKSYGGSGILKESIDTLIELNSIDNYIEKHREFLCNTRGTDCADWLREVMSWKW